MMITYSLATDADLQGILDLQQRNLPRALDAGEIARQGFVTVEHTYDLLRQLNDTEQHMVARDGDKVVGYILAMTAKARHDVPVLVSMFDEFDRTPFRDGMVADFRYLVVGQVCIDKPYRGQGIFDGCYQAYRDRYECKYEFAITEIALTNQRSLHAHQRLGFTVLKTYQDPGSPDWAIVAWDWRAGRA